MNATRPAHTPPDWTRGYLSASVPLWRRLPRRFVFATLALGALAFGLWAALGGPGPNPWLRLLAPPGQEVEGDWCDARWYDPVRCMEDRYDADRDALEATPPPSHIARAICEVGRCESRIDLEGPWVTACAHVAGHSASAPPTSLFDLITSDAYESAHLMNLESNLRREDAEQRRAHPEYDGYYAGLKLPRQHAACAPTVAIYKRMWQRHLEREGVNGPNARNAERLLELLGE